MTPVVITFKLSKICKIRNKLAVAIEVLKVVNEDLEHNDTFASFKMPKDSIIYE